MIMDILPYIIIGSGIAFIICIIVRTILIIDLHNTMKYFAGHKK